MNKKHIAIAMLAMPLAFSAHAQTVTDEDSDAANLPTAEAEFADTALPDLSDAEVPSLADVLSEMSDVEISEMEQSVFDAGALDFDTQSMIQNEIEAALEEGLISPEQASDVDIALEIVNANAEFFDFDILKEISELIAEGEFSEAQIRQTLQAFDSLSDADKALVTSEEFDANDVNNALYQQVSAEGKAIIQANMPVLTTP
jgi:hypothetical protein